MTSNQVNVKQLTGSTPSNHSSVQYSTFYKWNVSEWIGYKTVWKDGVDMVNFVWCKACAKHAADIKKDRNIRGVARKEIDKFAVGTSNVTKFNVTRHLGGIVSILSCILIKALSQEIKRWIVRDALQQNSEQVAEKV